MLNECITEEWRAVPGWEGVYGVSDHGRVRSLARRVPHKDGGSHTVSGRVMRPFATRGGYLMVILQRQGSRTHRTVHALVASAFIGPRPPGLFVLHYDGDPANNRVENLRYGTAKENTADAIRHGTCAVAKKGSAHRSAVLTEAKVREIRARYLSGETQVRLAAAYCVRQTTISRIVRRELWTHVS